MDSIIEVQRQTHEEIERFERALSTILSRQHKTHKAHLAAEHKASDILDRIVARSVTLQNAYDDIDGTRKAEIDLLAAPAKPGINDLDEFYKRFKKLQDHHTRYPNQPINGFEIELAAMVDDMEEQMDDEYEQDDPINTLFSGEERYGLCLDLYASHTQYNNLKNVPKRLQYLQYLDALATVSNGSLHPELPKDCKHSKDYENYLSGLYTYLLSFSKRTQPLVDVESLQRRSEEEFASLWEEGKVPGWESKPQAQSTEGEIWCAACQRSYTKQTVYDAHLTSKKHQKAAAKLEAEGGSAANGTAHQNGAPHPNGASKSQASTSKGRNSARLTHLITSLLVPLLPTIAETKANVERRFSLTAREREEELVDEAPIAAPADSENAVQDEEPEEEERIYNPLKLPLGWDGKPIPYWLYKLHGLGVEYRCEICSDFVYMGRKNFERHFQEARHAFGMRALGLPNTKHFHEITKIEDALALAEKLKREGRKEISQNETTEEMEDEEGNVYNRKTYEDLKKQGLI
ncbi:Splicing factor 3A subunit 3 AltName: Full=Protein noisette [Serendipita indica DSM 11827]|uniref:Related to RNA splicing factor PRP9 n=1 Tax=Serendipita indica (strain DSM 11827) TaxID=1109443 RepID=G4TWM5_SERID|nr:Splicing factor 3A subunit 3 AltName: Full=Protein noisette [Serendipita indica DSM 11827]CCA75718.1 related to RNA splicing factor PRP9 [Serendipita indica DSM 11827]